MRTVIGAVQDARFLGRRRRAQNTEQPEIVGSHTALEAAMAPQWGCAAQQIFPASGAVGTSRSVAAVYFVAYFLTGAGVSGSLHVAVGAHGTLEGGPLVAASPPPGTVLPTPIPLPDATDIVVSATVPMLAAGQTYQTQLYNDTCQAPVVAGTFST